ncbi:MAG: DUF222 domain-containing protein [Acidimicrobiales bacterium]
MEARPYEGCSDDELGRTAGQLHAAICATQASLMDVLAEMEHRESYRTDGAPTLTAWVVMALGTSYSSASQLVRAATAVQALPEIRSAFGEGRLSFDQLRPALSLATPETDAEWAQEAPGMSAASLEAMARRARQRSAKDEADEHRRRYLSLRDRGDHYRLSGRLTAADGAVVAKALGRLADAAPASPDGTFEPYDARMADALADLASSSLSLARDADRATLVLHLQLPDLQAYEGSGQLENGPGISSETARRLTCDARLQACAWRDGKPLGLGRIRRGVPAWLQRVLAERDGGCRFPGCGRTRLIHAHHVWHWAKGGPTDVGNLALLCRFHHRLVHEGGWSLRGDADGELFFYDPGGSVVSSRPVPLIPEVRARLPYADLIGPAGQESASRASSACP